MNNALLFGSEIVLRAGTQTVQGVPEVLSGGVYIPATEITETSDTPTTVVPIMSSPDIRDIVSYTTDKIAGNTLKTFLFSASSFVGKSISSATSAALFYIPTAGATANIAAGETMVLAGVTATHVGTTTAEAVQLYVQQFYAYATAGTQGANWTFTGTLSPDFDVFLGIDDVALTTLDYLFFIAKDPLAALTALAVTGTHAGLVNNTNYAVKTTVGSATQWNVPELVPYLEAAGLAPTFTTTLDYPASVRNMLLKEETFKDSQAAFRATALTALKNLKSLIAAIEALELGADGQAAITTLKNNVNTLYNLQNASYQTVLSVNSAVAKAKNVFKDHISNGEYFSATEDLRLAVGGMNLAGFIVIPTSLAAGKTLTILGRTLTTTTSLTKADIRDRFVSGTDVTGTITTGYTFAARLESDELGINFSGSALDWAVTKASSVAGYVDSITVSYPFATVFATSTLRTTITANVAALETDNAASSATLSALKAEASRAWALARTVIGAQDAAYTAATTSGGWVTDFADFAADNTFFPNKLVYAYANMTCADTGILNLNRMTVESQRMTESGDRIKLTTLTDAVISSFDLTIMANQPPEISMTMTGEPYSVAFADGATIDFSNLRLQTMPSMTGSNVTFLSLAPVGESYVDGNIQLQELSLPNMAGLSASRISTATGNFYRISADRVGRKLSLTVLDGDRSAVVGAITDYKAYINQKFRFRLQVGAISGFIYRLEVEGLLTNVQPTTVQQALSGEQLEITATSVSLIWE